MHRQKARLLLKLGLLVVLGDLVVAWWLILPAPTCCISRTSGATAKMHEFSAKLEAYRLISGRYPTTSQGLDALVTCPTDVPTPTRWRSQFKALPLDPWLQPYRYHLSRDEKSFVLTSSGPDTIIGSPDDITYSSLH